MNAKSWVEQFCKRFPGGLKIATPLGLGKPNEILNEFYRRAKHDPKFSLTIYTALSLTRPEPKEDLARRFFRPFSERHWGKNYPDLEYARDAERNRLPPNVKIHEFYFQAGAALKSESLQRHYQSLNYTHVAAVVAEANIDLIVQMVARRGDRYSLSSNPDLTLDVADLMREANQPLFMLGVVHPDSPFLGGEAEVAAEFFDDILEIPQPAPKLFALPRAPVTPADHCVGFFTSQLIVDDGTLQIGIGSLSDAVVASLILRHKENSAYRSLQSGQPSFGIEVNNEPFQKGLYGLSELINDGFMHLRRADILKRCVVDELTNTETYLHGAFFLGSQPFYDWLRQLEGRDAAGLKMGRVSKINDLFDPNETLLRQQRKNPRFVNTCMQVTLLGAAASDTLDDGRVVSGVGGQYNFVAMSHELKNSKSILMLRSTRESQGRVTSNIVWSHGQTTIPRHLRDVVVTEYGIANLRGKSDEETITALLNVTDSRFQQTLLDEAKRRGKVAASYQIPDALKNNFPEKIDRFVNEGKKLGAFATYPFGSDFSPEEERLLLALGRIKELKTWRRLSRLARPANPARFATELARLNLASPKTAKERMYRRLVCWALGQSD